MDVLHLCPSLVFSLLLVLNAIDMNNTTAQAITLPNRELSVSWTPTDGARTALGQVGTQSTLLCSFNHS